MSGGQRDGCLFCSIARITLFVISAIVGWTWLRRRLEEDDQIRELEREIRELPLDSRKRLLERFPEHMQEMDVNGALTINRAIKVASAGGVVGLAGWVGATAVYRLSNRPPDPDSGPGLDPDWVFCVLFWFIITLMMTVVYLYCYILCGTGEDTEEILCRDRCFREMAVIYWLFLMLWASMCAVSRPS